MVAMISGALAWAGQGMPRLHFRLPSPMTTAVWNALCVIRKNKPLRWLIADNVPGIRLSGRGQTCCYWDQWTELALGEDKNAARLTMALCHEAAHARQIKRWNEFSYSWAARGLRERDALEHAIPSFTLCGMTEKDRRWYSGGCLSTRWWER